MTKVSRVGWRRWGAVAATLVMLASLAGVADAGARTPTIAPLGHLPKTATLDYSQAPPGRLTPLSPKFVAETLGLSFPSAPAASSTSFSQATAPAPPSVVNPVTSPVYQCVNGHQTADPLSPPCVARFSGDNGGATYRGVNRNEVRILIRMGGGFDHRSAPMENQESPNDELVDLGRSPAPNEYYLATKARLLQNYFNRHFQLYGRRIHLFVYFDGDSNELRKPDNPEHQHKAALDVLWRVNPFVAFQFNDAENIEDAGAFFDTLARAGTVAFDARNFLSEARFDRVPDRIWGYLPTAEKMTDLFASYVCRKVVGKPVSMSGNAGENGRPRRLGLVYPDDTRPAVYRLVTAMARRRLAACGARIAAEAALTPTAECGNRQGPFVDQDGSTVVDTLKRAAVTTVLWLGCNDHNIPPAATASGYLPEWILLGDGNRDIEPTVATDDARALFDHHAVAVTWQPTLPSFSQVHCYAAQRESDPTLPAAPPTKPGRITSIFDPGTPPPFETANEADFACGLYSALLQVAGAIQLGGPRLTAGSVAAGLHALPHLSSRDPQTPSCFYGAGHSCIRDSAAWYWDGSMGCFRAIERGRRYLAGKWPAGNVDAQITGKEPCASLK